MMLLNRKPYIVILLLLFNISCSDFWNKNSTVVLSNQIDPYATEYIKKHSLLNKGEELIAYYDNSISLDGTEAAIITKRRVIYHKNGNSDSIFIRDIKKIIYTKAESIFDNDIILMQSRKNKFMKIEICATCQSKTFLDIIESMR